MTFRPLKWIVFAPVAALPLLAALVISPESPGSGAWGLFQTHWVWLLAAMGLGIWFGWATSAGGNA